MNIFYLHHLPIIAAKMHCDKHVVKMCLETAQILAAVHHIHGNDNVTYKLTHQNHPCVKWAAQSPTHYKWLQRLGEELCNEYRFRYDRDHKCEQYIKGELSDPPIALAAAPFFWCEPPKCMPNECKRDSVVESYQEYYRQAKRAFATWKVRQAPAFMST